jgi:putative transposase
MHAIGFKYARYINNRYKRTGAVFEGRYRSTIIDTERYWYLCMRYVELNPVRAGFVSTPHAYYWSSYTTHASGSPDPLVTLHPQYLALGRTPRERQECWRRHCADAFQPRRARDHPQGRPRRRRARRPRHSGRGHLTHATKCESALHGCLTPVIEVIGVRPL